MMDGDLRDLYQDVILQHNKSPRNKGRLTKPDALLEGFNPLCGDRLTLSVRFDGDRVVEVAFDGNGCAISTASASLMTESIKGKSRAEIRQLFAAFHGMVTRDGPPPTRETMGKLHVFVGVGEFPARVKCATLCWHTVKAIVDGKAGQVTTE